MTEELRAAAERVRNFIDDWKHYYTPGQGIGNRVSLPWKVYGDVELIVNELAEHPADDGEPVTEEWLRSVGWQDWELDDDDDDPEYTLWTKANSSLGWKTRLAYESNGFYLVRMVDEDAEDYFGSSESVELFDSRNSSKIITRGQVRQLLKALGIEAKEQKQ